MTRLPELSHTRSPDRTPAAAVGDRCGRTDMPIASASGGATIVSSMRTLRTKASELLGRRRVARYRRSQASEALRAKRAADELARVREGAERFPRTGGGGM